MTATVDRRATRLEGHALVARGAPFGKDGRRVARRRYWSGTAGRGRALCGCGRTSPVLDTVAERIAWHLDHKAQVRAGAGAPC